MIWFLSYLSAGLSYSFLRRMLDPDAVMDTDLHWAGIEILVWPLFFIWSMIKLLGKGALFLFEILLEMMD